MIIFKNGGYMQNPQFPDTFFEDADYVLADDSELANKYLSLLSEGAFPKLITNEDDTVIIDVVRNEKDITQIKTLAEINELKIELQSEDYKIIKCYEASLVGQDLPYDIFELKIKRDEIRNQINELERSINVYNN